MLGVSKSHKPIKLFEAKPASIVIVNFVNRMLQDLPGLLCVLGINHDPMLKGLNLEVPLLLSTHFTNLTYRRP